MHLQKSENTHSSKYSLLLQCFIYTFFIAFITYGYHYSSSNFAYDGLVGSDLRADSMTKIQFGRYSQLLNFHFRGFVSAPWIVGILSTAWASLSVFFIAKIFGLTNKISLIIISGLIITAPTFAYSHNVFLHEVDNFSLAFLFGVLSVYLYTNRPFCGSVLVALSTFVLCVSFYTPYISIIPTLFLLVLIQDIFSGKSTRAFLIKIAKFVGFCFIGGLIYLAIYKTLFLVLGMQPADSYNSVNSIISKSPVGYFLSFLREFVFSYYIIIIRILRPVTYNTNIVGALFALAALLTAFNFIRTIVLSKLTKKQLALLAVTILLLVPSLFLARLLASGLSHYGTQYPELLIFFVFLIFAINYERCRTKSSAPVDRLGAYSYKIVLGILFIGLFANWIFANRLFYLRELTATTTHSFYTRLVHDIEKNEHYKPQETSVVFIGGAQRSPYLHKRENFKECEFVYFQTGPTTIEYDIASNVTRYVRHHLGSSLIVERVIDNIDEIPEPCRLMPLYPKSGSMVMLDNKLYVNISPIKE